jgi:hypothetical protein
LKWVWKSKIPPPVRHGQWSNFWMPKMFARLKFIGSFVKFVEKMLWVMRWWEDGVGWSVKGGRMFTMMIEVAASHCRSAWPGEWEDSIKQKINHVWAEYVFPAHFLPAERFSSDDEVKADVQHWVKTLAAEFFDKGIQKLVPRYDKCLSLGGNYVEK